MAGTLFEVEAPLDWESASPIVAEGVTCDFCHTISGNENLGKKISVGAYVYPRRGQTAVKYGRHQDTDNPVHLTEVSQFLTSSEFCAVCHKFKHPVAGSEIQNTYEEWLAGPYSRRGVRCQDCHMPSYPGATVAGGKHREKLHAHVFVGGHTEMLRKAARVTVSGVVGTQSGKRLLTVQANVRNTGAGHSIPTGIPGIREMRLEIQVLGAGGQQLGRERFRFGQ